ncbi:hypothetical protein MTO96_005179 [Rhipicephalus appendiculatus]
MEEPEWRRPKGARAPVTPAAPPGPAGVFDLGEGVRPPRRRLRPDRGRRPPGPGAVDPDRAPGRPGSASALPVDDHFIRTTRLSRGEKACCRARGGRCSARAASHMGPKLNTATAAVLLHLRLHRRAGVTGFPVEAGGEEDREEKAKVLSGKK